MPYFLNEFTLAINIALMWHFILYIFILFCLILFSTWLQGLIANALLTTSIVFLVTLAPTLASMACGTFQMIVLFPLQKFVLLKEKKENNK